MAKRPAIAKFFGSFGSKRMWMSLNHIHRNTGGNGLQKLQKVSTPSYECLKYENTRAGFYWCEYPREQAQKALDSGNYRNKLCPYHGARWTDPNWKLSWVEVQHDSIGQVLKDHNDYPIASSQFIRPPCFCSPWLRNDHGMKGRYVWMVRTKPEEFRFCQCKGCVTGDDQKYVLNKKHENIFASAFLDKD